jgi:hypothetical protein
MPWEPGSMLSRDLGEFSAQVKAKADALRSAAGDSLSQAEKIRGGGLKAAGGGSAPERLAQPKPASNAPAPPNVGDEVDGYVFKGGNPADKSNWVQRTDKQPSSLGTAASILERKK